MCRSKSRLVVAVECGVKLAVQGSMLQRAADRLLAAHSSGYRRSQEMRTGSQAWQKRALGRYADKALLAFAFDHLGLSCSSDDVTMGAVVSGDLDKLQWLHPVMRVPLCTKSIMIAARFGHIDILDWLLLQEGAKLNAAVMKSAAKGGQLVMCQHLRSIGCDWDASACIDAAAQGHVSVLSWLRESGCPSEYLELVMIAAYSGCIAMMQYVLDQHAVQLESTMTHVEVLTEMLEHAGIIDNLDAAKWLRQQGAEWPPTILVANWHHGEVLVWARAEGCTSPY
jgi:hypothetical protein